MGTLIRNGRSYSNSASDANVVQYKNTNSKLKSTNVQNAIDEVVEKSATKFISGTSLQKIYVSPSGSDTGTGLKASPFKTINRAIQSLPNILNADVQIILNGGTYTEDIDIQGYSGDLSLVINGAIIINGCISITGCSIVHFSTIDSTISNSLTVNNTSNHPIRIYSSYVTYDSSTLIVNGSMNISGIFCSNSIVAIVSQVTCNSCRYGVSAVFSSNVFITKLSGSGEYSGDVETGSILTVADNRFAFTVGDFYRLNDALAQSKYASIISYETYTKMKEAGSFDSDTVYYVLDDEEGDDDEPDAFNATNLDYDDTNTALGVTNVQRAIERIVEKINSGHETMVSITGAGTVAIPTSTHKDIVVEQFCNGLCHSYIIPVKALSDTQKTYRSGYFKSTDEYESTSIIIENKSITNVSFIVNGIESIDNTT